MESIEVKKGGRPRTPNRQGLYARVATKTDDIIDTLFRLLHSRNESISLGAAKVLIDRLLPDLKAVNVDVQNVPPIKVIVDMKSGYIPPTVRNFTS